MSLVKKNFYIYIASFLVTGVVGLVFNPLFVGLLGADLFGIWRYTQRILEVISVADGRGAQLLKMMVARERDLKIRREAVGGAVLLWIIHVPVLVFCLWLTFTFFLKDYAGLGDLSSKDFLFFYVLLGINILLAQVLGIPDSVLYGIGLSYKSTTTQMMGVLFLNIGLYFVLNLGFGLVGLGGVTVISSVAMAVILLYLVISGVDWFGIEMPNYGALLTQGINNGFMVLWLLIEKLLMVVDLLIVGALFGPAFFSSATFVFFIPQLMLGVLVFFFAALGPDFARMVVHGEKEEKINFIRFVRESNFGFSVFMAMLYVLFNESFVVNWVGDGYHLGKTCDIAIGLVIIQVAHIRNEAQMQDAYLGVRSRVLLGGFGVVLGISMSLAFVGLFSKDVFLVFLGGFVGRLIINIKYHSLLDGFVDCSPGKGRVGGALLVYCVASAISFLIPVNGVLFLFFSFSILFFLFGFVAWHRFLSKDTRFYLIKKFI